MTGKIKLVHSGGNAVSIAVPSSNPSASEVEFKLPGSDGSANQVLKTDGSGNLSFGADQGGKILQVKQTFLNTAVSISGITGYTTITGFEANITPASLGIWSALLGGAPSPGENQNKLPNLTICIGNLCFTSTSLTALSRVAPSDSNNW